VFNIQDVEVLFGHFLQGVHGHIELPEPDHFADSVYGSSGH